jgi:hypothetical protein
LYDIAENIYSDLDVCLETTETFLLFFFHNAGFLPKMEGMGGLLAQAKASPSEVQKSKVAMISPA